MYFFKKQILQLKKKIDTFGKVLAILTKKQPNKTNLLQIIGIETKQRT